MKTFLFSFLIFTYFCLNFVNAQINETKLVPMGGQLSDNYGYSVASDGNYIIMGSPYSNDFGTHTGSAYLYENTGGVWTEKSKLMASDAAELQDFGCSVSISGDVILIGAFRDDQNGIEAGAAYIFNRDSVTGNWTQQQKLLAGDGSAYDEFGYSVSLRGDFAIIGAPLDNVNSVEVGSAYIFKWNDTAWVEEAKLIASNGVGSSPVFGRSVSIYGDYAIIGASHDEELGTHVGAAYIFHFDGINWIQQIKLHASNVNMNNNFGHSVSMYDDYAVIGSIGAVTAAGGAAFIFHRNGTTWTEEAMLEGISSFTNSNFGESVSIDGDYLVIGASEDDANGDHAGCVYIFKHDGIDWTEQAMVLASDGTEDDKMGRSVFIEDDQVLAGAPGQEAGAQYCGAVYVYTGFVTDISDPDKSNLPLNFSLEQNYPNPFNPSTTIKFTISEFGFVSLKVFDLLGNEVVTLVDEYKTAGSYEVEFNSHSGEVRNLPSGIYFYQINSGKFVKTKKMVLLK